MALLTINGKTDFLIADVIIIRNKDSITALVAGCWYINFRFYKLSKRTW